MNLKALFLPNLLFFLISLDSVSGQGICVNGGYFKRNSTYDLNRRLVISSLASNVTAHNGFLNSSIGQNANRVYVLSMCIPGTKTEACSECLQGASVLLLRDCPKQKEAYTWTDCCMARYSNTSLSGSLLMEPSRVLPNPRDITDMVVSNLTEFRRVWSELMVRTISATVSLSNKKSFKHKYYAAEAVSLPYFRAVYAMMQCTPDVSSRDCEYCLKTNVADYESCCSSRQGGAVVRPICFIRWDMYSFAGAFENTTFLPPPPQSPPSLNPPVSERANTTRKDGKSISIGTTVAIVVPTIFILALLVVGFTVWRRKRSYRTNELQAGGEITTSQPLQFSFKTIEDATDKFSDSNLIGRGGFGEVYRGTLLSGTEAAFKRLSKTSGQGAQEFKNEAVLVAKLQHKNLVRLLGFCLEGEEKILVYEFVPNKSLDYFLFDPKMQDKLDWKRRYNIIVGIARGLLYLHQDSRLTIIHRDLKAGNILLDAHMNPKIADFGMARIIGIDQTQVNTRRIVGTYGYMSPEYAIRGHFSVKSDVYSFGVMILEIICGKKNSSFYHIDDSAGNLVTHAWGLWRNDSPFELVDPTIRKSYQRYKVLRCIHIALLCVQEDPADRPGLPVIIVMLTNSTSSLPVPRAPGFCLQGRNEFPSQSTSTSIRVSINDVTITDLDSR